MVIVDLSHMSLEKNGRALAIECPLCETWVIADSCFLLKKQTFERNQNDPPLDTLARCRRCGYVSKQPEQAVARSKVSSKMELATLIMIRKSRPDIETSISLPDPKSVPPLPAEVLINSLHQALTSFSQTDLMNSLMLAEIVFGLPIIVILYKVSPLKELTALGGALFLVCLLVLSYIWKQRDADRNVCNEMLPIVRKWQETTGRSIMDLALTASGISGTASRHLHRMEGEYRVR